ncbi:hypothetical protein [Tropicibacter oceani]|uniref:Uncharacterized protein n=1 Tax=Tropicibacter oceani TaxID=3058420 RepID=A0ABY8QLB5_9RHOB|nr:hypothetical protein [Tropicibacter oceani]WGW05320.1 hypothetical protein QF118_07170 [Tropicibacter oceani]
MDHEFFVDSVAIPPSVPATFRLGDEPFLYVMVHDGKIVRIDQIAVNGATYRQFMWEPGSAEVGVRTPEEHESEFSANPCRGPADSKRCLWNSGQPVIVLFWHPESALCAIVGKIGTSATLNYMTHRSECAGML